MESDPKSALGHLNRGIAAFEDGDLETARRHFAQTLHDEPENELAWLWLAEASETPGQKRYCLDRAVAVNPDSSANFRRDALRTAADQHRLGRPLLRLVGAEGAQRGHEVDQAGVDAGGHLGVHLGADVALRDGRGRVRFLEEK